MFMRKIYFCLLLVAYSAAFGEFHACYCAVVELQLINISS